MEGLFKLLTSYLAIAIEACASLFIAFAAIEAVWRTFVMYFRQRRTPEELTEAIRLRFGRWLSLALEFELAADILRTAISPGWTEIGQLAAIVVLRTVLNFFLQQEIDKVAERDARIAKLRDRDS
jgi:uncharacterized membrane protein